MRTIGRTAALSVVLGVVAGSAWAVQVGDAAPALTIDTWVQGTAVDLADPDTIKVVEFWATWCGPCRQSIPHLDKMQDELGEKGVRIIGITDEAPETVKAFLDQMGDGMSYAVAVDGQNVTWDKYMKPLGLNGIPHAFIVDKAGKVAWHGHPMGGLDEALAKVMAGESMAPAAEADALTQALVPVWIEEYKILARFGTDHARADEVGKRILDAAKTMPRALNHLAWHILVNPDVNYRNLDAALMMAEAAVKGSNGESASILDTYARALFDLGRVQDAVKQQEMAVEKAQDAEERAALAATLESYKSAASN